ncbi:hypothetical protein C2G38_2136989 [Gigaspora rosea]|uniref:Uncharacterized protein n=1 Tax=Gigaspora rosea TaxID=44941 RepID=A0A397WBC5_9GLOM|nr:hypothetical protein C2G38_2136989 [Gigaspora rosea]
MIGIFPKFNKIVLVVGDNVRSRKESQILRAFISSARRHGAEVFFSNRLHAKRGINAGKITTRVFSGDGPHDFALIDIKRMSKRLSPLTNIKNNLDSQHIELIINDDIPVSSYGTHLCRSGISTPVSCGYVEAFNVITVIKGLSSLI